METKEEGEGVIEELDDKSFSSIVFFSPATLQAIIPSSSTSSSSSSSTLSYRLEIVWRSHTSAWLDFYDVPLPCDVDQSNPLHPKYHLELDLMAKVCRGEEGGEIDPSSGRLLSFTYSYHRLGQRMTFIIANNASGQVCDDLLAFDFLLSQYTFQPFLSSEEETGGAGPGGAEYPQPNVLARGLEGSGIALRTLLRSTGRYTGHAIRFLGRGYTDLHGYFQPPPDFSEQSDSVAGGGAGAGVVDPRSIHRAEKSRQWAHDVHSGARTVTSAALYPIRYFGSVAAAISPSSNTATSSGSAPANANSSSSSSSSSSSRSSRLFLDTIAGLGNGLASVCKGVTEALGEVGLAIGDSASYHSQTFYGPQYTSEVTDRYLEAAREIGLAGYKVTNVASLGVAGWLVNAAIEGGSMLMALYDYLLGPILLQGWVDVVQPPLWQKKRYWTVLRPWSLAFYNHPRETIGKPVRIVITSMLDTLPKLHRMTSSSSSSLSLPTTAMEESVAVVDDESSSSSSAAAVVMERMEVDDGSREQMLLEEDVDPVVRPNHSIMNKNGWKRVWQNWKGGEEDHIELCTVDCSSYLLYPCPTTTSVMERWFDELSLACRRVETVAKRRSGAEDLALERRLKLFPRSHQVIITVKRALLAQQAMNKKKLSFLPSARHGMPLSSSMKKEEEGEGAMFYSVSDQEAIQQTLEAEEEDHLRHTSAATSNTIEAETETRQQQHNSDVMTPTTASALLSSATAATATAANTTTATSKQIIFSRHPDATVSSSSSSSSSITSTSQRWKDKMWGNRELFLSLTPLTTYGIEIASERKQTSTALLYSLQDLLDHLHGQFQTSREPLGREEQEAIHDLLLFYGPLLHEDKPKAVVDWEYGSSQKVRGGGGGGGGVVLGEKIDLFQSGDVSRLDMVVSMKGMSGEKEVGRVVLLWDDLLYLTGNAALSQATTTSPPPSTASPPPSTTSPPLNTTSPPPNTTSPPLNTTSPPLSTTSHLLPGLRRTVQSCPSTEIWLPVMKTVAAGGEEEEEEQIGSLLLTIEIAPIS
eukprot:gene10336-11440_t